MTVASALNNLEKKLRFVYGMKGSAAVCKRPDPNEGCFKDLTGQTVNKLKQPQSLLCFEQEFGPDTS